MSGRRIVIIGGGLAGLSTGCYARMNDWETVIVEHGSGLGGVCTAWKRGPYTIDGCIHWLTGGPFMRVYEELHIVPPVELRVLEHFATYRNVTDGTELEVRSDFGAFRAGLVALGPGDEEEVDRILNGARAIADLDPGIDRPPEIASLGDRLRAMWGMRGDVGTLVRFRKPFRRYLDDHITSPKLRRALAALLPPESPALFLLFILGYLNAGYLSRPIGTTEVFRNALVNRYRALSGQARLDSTVEEVLVERDRARGVRLADGTMIHADLVVSTSSAPETVFRLLGGRYGAEPLTKRLRDWKLFDPVVLASFGVAAPMTNHPTTLILDGIRSLDVGGHENDQYVVRIFSDEPAAAPAGHTVIQVMVTSKYEWWATRGDGYGAAKDAIARQIVDRLSPHLPELRDAVRMTDVSTPITFWREARSWRGAFEGWMPTSDSFFSHLDKSLPGLDGFYMAGQWVEPGGGVPPALLSGRQLVQILCEQEKREFVVR